MGNVLLETKDLKKYFKTPRGDLHAVDGFSIKIEEGKTFGIVGESGCGKSTLGRLVLRLIEPTAGEILYEGKNILSLNKSQTREMRKKIQIIFQDPYSSLNPRMSVFEIIAEPLRSFHVFKSAKELEKRIFELMDLTGIAERWAQAYPHELDGGRRQRIGIARALALNPRLIICDEPVSALDVSIQAQVLNLLMDLQEQLGLTYMFISHDLSVVKHISDNIAVMYLGQCVEMAPSNVLFENPLHPYTKALLKAIPFPDIDLRGDAKAIIKGEISSPINPPEGCRFAARCDYREQCDGKSDKYELREIAPDHFVSCCMCR